MASLPPGQGGEAVAMETGDALVRQVESVERNMAFLRQEHLTLLRGLHLEILSLQRRCAELTCELNLKPPGRTQAEVEEEEEQLKARCEQAEARLREQQCTLGDLRRELSQKGALAGALRAALKDRERRFLDELKRRSHRVTALSGELQRQTDSAARLSFQLYSARQRLQQQEEEPPRSPAPRGAHRPPPTPPPAPPPAARPKRRSHRPAAVVRAERARECVPRERVTGPEDPAPMPDPALFLYPRRHRPRPRHAHRSQRGQVVVAAEGGREGPADGGGPRVDPAPAAGIATATEAE
ncbi:coiled-coil domain-containing 92B-like [Anguilla rostrata]|uniref:coiled-coil domain-containing 92B-like n=1 Tax=Anguilla rostrata TaxID=7938 RepID=UPI0030CDC4C5